jgi:zinc transporter, ZIP family
MSGEFLMVIAIAAFASFLTYLGAPLAERFDPPAALISAALQFAAGIITALVALSLMPPAVRGGSSLAIALAFFLGGALYVGFEYYSARKLAAVAPPGALVPSAGLFAGILVDLFIDGVVIGVGATLTLATGLLLALGLAISTMPLAFVTTSTARQQGVSPERRRLLSILYVVCIMAGAILGYALLRNQPETVRLILIAFASGFLITTVTQSMIPEANKDGEPNFSGILFLAGLTLYAILTLTIK